MSKHPLPAKQPALRALALAAALATTGMAPAWAGDVRFTIQKWFAPGGFGLEPSFMEATAINAHGEIAGTADYRTANGSGSTAFTVLNGVYHEYSNPRGGGSVATALSDTGLMLGTFRMGFPGEPRGAFLVGRDRQVSIVASADDVAGAMDSTGTWLALNRQVVAGDRAYVGRVGGVPQLVGPGTISVINRHGDYVRVDESTRAPVVMRGGRSLAFPREVSFSDMNSAGDVVGRRFASGAFSGVVLRGNELVDLGTDNVSGWANPLAISDHGVIVGEIGEPGEPRAAAYDPKRGFVHLASLTTGLGGATLYSAQAINAHHQIAGKGLEGDLWFAYVLTPTGTLRWDGGVTGRFSDAANWDSGAGLMPGKFLDTVIAPAGDVRVVADTPTLMKSLTVGSTSGGSLATLVLSGGARLEATASPVLIEARGRLSGNGSIAGSLMNRGTIGEASGAQLSLTITGELDNRGLIQGSGSIAASLINRGTGDGVRAEAGRTLRFIGNIHSNADGGRIEVRQGAELSFSGQLVNQGGSFLRIDDGTLRTGSLANGGLMQIGFGGASIFGDVVNSPALDANRGRIIASGGADVTFWDRVVNRGEIRASAGSRILYFGAASGNGTFTSNGGGYHRFEGGFTPVAANAAASAEAADAAAADAPQAAATASLGDVQFASVVTMTLSGLVAGVGHDQLVFSASVLFDSGSSLQVLLGDGFTPALGQSFQLFDYAQAPRGQFDALLLPTLAPTLVWDTSGLYSSGMLAVQAVPEPQSWALLLSGVAVLGWLRRRRAADVGTDRS